MLTIRNIIRGSEHCKTEGISTSVSYQGLRSQRRIRPQKVEVSNHTEKSKQLESSDLPLCSSLYNDIIAPYVICVSYPNVLCSLT